VYGYSPQTTEELISQLQAHPYVTFEGLFEAAETPQETLPESLQQLASQTPRKPGKGQLDLLFLCQYDHRAEELLEALLSDDGRVIDLTNTLRPWSESEQIAPEHINENDMMYGLPSLQKKQLKQASVVASPGALSTCLGLALTPLATSGQLHHPIFVQQTTRPAPHQRRRQPTPIFAPVPDGIQKRQKSELHMVEEFLETKMDDNEEQPELIFTPQPSNKRMMRIACLTKLEQLTPAELSELYALRYAAEPQVTILPNSQIAHTMRVYNTNQVELSVHPFQQQRQVLILIAVDRHFKGKSGQAIQNMNTMFGWNEQMGLQPTA
jgi:N-acetyl-gamma-glutamyl-phosphate reductase